MLTVLMTCVVTMVVSGAPGHDLVLVDGDTGQMSKLYRTAINMMEERMDKIQVNSLHLLNDFFPNNRKARSLQI